MWIFVLGLLAINGLSRYDRLRGVEYSVLFPVASQYEKEITEKKIMVLGDDISLYKENKLAGYFLDWNLSRKYFEQSDYYENIIKINKSISDDPPDVIIDPGNLMGSVMVRIPSLEKKYRKEKEVYWKR